MLPRPSNSDPAPSADWIEASCLVSRDAALSRSDIVGILSVIGESAPEEQAETTWIQLQGRRSVLGAEYPFEIEQESVALRDTNPARNAYLAMLLISIRAYIAEARTNPITDYTRLFEYLTAEAARRYVSGQSVRIGWPREAPVPAGFGDLIEYLSDLLREGPTGPVLNEPDKDAGADVVAWRPFADGRAGQLIVLAQCATGGNWKEKATELQCLEWQRYIQFAVEPIRVLAIPHIEPDAGRWVKYSSRGGVILDRVRITELLGGDPYGQLADEVNDWLEGEIVRLRLVESEAGLS
ncbi:MAG: hypothetical protein FD171_51 [Actinobacteria bacterium]|nr:MAG: hypothetical protein FD171_51 [Actinomycetota bacterium]